jgi:hypothetical protein
MSTESLAKYSDLRLCRVLNYLGRRVGRRSYALRQLILAELGQRVAVQYKRRHYQ